MTTAITGYTRNEFIADLVDIVGNNSASFVTQCQNNITAWVYEFYAAHDWKFTYKNGVAANYKILTVNNQSAYILNTATSGFEGKSVYVESVYSQLPGQQRRLIKQDLQGLRAGDPGQVATGYAQCWFPAGENSIVVWPTPVTGNGAGETLFLDGKVLGAEINSNVTIPIPYDKQETFLQFCLYKCLRRERDPRAAAEYQQYLEDKKHAINDDMRDEESNEQVKTVNEQLGTPNNLGVLNWRLWNTFNY